MIRRSKYVQAISKMEAGSDQVGIARIEHFLDCIEDMCNSQILDEIKIEAKLGDCQVCEQTASGPDFEVYNHKFAEDSSVYEGSLDAAGRAHGTGLLRDEHCIFSGDFEHGAGNRAGTATAAGGVRASGRWRGGVLEGVARVELDTGAWTVAEYRHGVRHGPARQFSCDCQLRLLGVYKEGQLVGPVYKGCLGGGYLVGQVNKDGKLSGDDIAFVYPDFRTAIKGQFEDGSLVRGKECRIVSSVSCKGFVLPVYGPETGRDLVYDPSTSTCISRWPTLRDAWERQLVAVRPSLIPQAGEGLFAVEDLPAKSEVALFQGVKVPADKDGVGRQHSDYRIRLNADLDLDIPDEMTCLERYSATLGHKANHSFVPNSEWSVFEHPRFGLIRSIRSKVDIAAGDEITVNYNLEMCRAPDWYKALWVKHLTVDKGWSQEQLEKYLERWWRVCFT